MGERLCSEDFVRPESTIGVVFGGLFTEHQMGVKVFLLKGLRNLGKISVDFPVKYRMKLISRNIRGDFPAMQRKTTYFYDSRANRRNFSVY